ncbi:unnamed protein product [Amoebophrya sp. A120]|nr:unnamed protein product [Amoebophrya sp. A120]|eukprot:GSA120T00003005001.1
MGCEQSRPLQSPSGQGPQLRDEEQRRPNSLEAKIVLLGDSGVGKSSLALRYCQGRFSPFHEVTIGAAFLQQMIRLPDGQQLKLHIWDTGGQERFRAMAPLYYRDALGALIVYDHNDGASWEAVRYWVDELRNKGPENVCLGVVANKADVEPTGEATGTDAEQARAWCTEQGMLFTKASAKTGEGVNTVFATLANRIYQDILSKR